MAIRKTEENSKRCICGQCPSYSDCLRDRTESLFCASGKASCEIKKSGCLCGGCPITIEHSLNGGYWCIEGAVE